MVWSKLPDPPESAIPELQREMGGTATYLVDENLGIRVAEVIAYLGHDVKYAHDVGLRGRPDHEVFAYAWEEKRVLLTHDRDFLNDRRFPYIRNPGVIVLPGADGDQESLIRSLAQILGMFETFSGLWEKPKITIDHGQIWTVRHLRRGLEGIVRHKFKFSPGCVYKWEDDD